MSDNPEVGRELLASDLKVRDVVICAPSWAPEVAFTLWVVAIEGRTVTFLSGMLGVRAQAFRTTEDGLVDSLGRRLQVFEYLGEV